MASRSLLPCLIATGSALATLASALPAAAAGMPLLAHRAVYDLTLGKTKGGSAPVSARGRIVYEFSGSACEGYSTTFRQITEIQMDEGSARISDMSSSTYEDGDGTGFRFKTDTSVDGRLVDSIDGRARRSADGGMAVDLTKPVPAKTDLPAGAIFPTAQILEIVAAAKKDERTAELKVFDGSDNGQKVFDTLTIIGHAADSPPPDKAATGVPQLRDTPRWPVSISYFDPDKRDGPPNYVLGFDLYENGVSGELRIDYGNYVLNGEMTKFELLPQKPCN
jgi:hypothetical protein